MSKSGWDRGDSVEKHGFPPIMGKRATLEERRKQTAAIRHHIKVCKRVAELERAREEERRELTPIQEISLPLRLRSFSAFFFFLQCRRFTFGDVAIYHWWHSRNSRLQLSKFSASHLLYASVTDYNTSRTTM